MPPFSKVRRNLPVLYGFLMASQSASSGYIQIYVFDL